jgi:hypothetical protein
MRTRGMGGVLAVAGLALVAAGCPQQDATVADRDGVAAVDTARVEGDASREAAVEERVDLASVHESGVEGEAMIHAQNGRTHVMLSVRGARPNSALAAHIHAGRCDTLGPVVEGLESVRTDQTGVGRSESTVGVEPGTVLNGQHFIAVHQEDAGDAGPPVACGDLPQRDVRRQP